MKFKKKTAMLVSFTLGTLLVASTALADIANKSGYDQMKDALKLTAQQSNEKFDSFTTDFSIELKDNGKTLGTSSGTQKFDRSKSATERINSSTGNQGGDMFYSYSDKTSMINWQGSDPTYNVTEFTQERKEELFPDPFKQDSAGDIEKIADAVVGSLKDHVVVTENPDGSKGIAGSLTEVQIPSLVNAVASLQLKQQFNGNRDNMPHLTKDVYVEEVKGTSKVNKDGVMESILGTFELSGKDEQGTAHDITVEFLAKLSKINSTTVTKPDLTGKKVVKIIAQDGNPGSEMSNPEKFIGKFKNDIIIEKDKKFVKVGERFIDITQIDNKTAAGRYYEVYKPGFEQYATTQRDLKFDAQKIAQNGNPSYDFTTESGGKGNIYFEQNEGKIIFNISNISSNGGVQFSPDL
ncbi:MAG TPA: hypothetical protein VIM51_07685 [Desulfosporosinus sp.]